MQLVQFDAFSDEIRDAQLDKKCDDIESALGQLRRSTLLASTAILDNGATSLMCGHLTLQRYLRELEAAGLQGELRAYPCARLFRFGNGGVCDAKWCAHLPVCFKGRRGTLLAYIVPGDTPLLFPRPLLELFGVKIDFSKKAVCSSILFVGTLSRRVGGGLIFRSRLTDGRLLVSLIWMVHDCCLVSRFL